MKKIYLLLLFISTSLSALEILYQQEPPYIKKDNGSISGVVATPTIKALDSLSIKYTLKEAKFKDQITQIQNTKKDICAIGWYKDPNFQKAFNYSDTIYKEKPYGIITQKRHKIEPNTHIDKLIVERKYRVMVKENYPYTKEFLQILNQLPMKKVKTNKDSNLITLIAKRKGDYMFVSYENAQYFLEKHKYRSRVKFIPLNGMPQGKARYFVCSKNVDISILKAFNNSLN